MPMVRAHVGARGRSANLATWRFNWGSPTVSGRLRQGRHHPVKGCGLCFVLSILIRTSQPCLTSERYGHALMVAERAVATCIAVRLDPALREQLVLSTAASSGSRD